MAQRVVEQDAHHAGDGARIAAAPARPGGGATSRSTPPRRRAARTRRRRHGTALRARRARSRSDTSASSRLRSSSSLARRARRRSRTGPEDLRRASSTGRGSPSREVLFEQLDRALQRGQRRAQLVEAVATNERRAASWRRSSRCIEASALARSPTSSRPSRRGRCIEPSSATRTAPPAGERADVRWWWRGRCRAGRRRQADGGGGEERAADLVTAVVTSVSCFWGDEQRSRRRGRRGRPGSRRGEVEREPRDVDDLTTMPWSLWRIVRATGRRSRSGSRRAEAGSLRSRSRRSAVRRPPSWRGSHGRRCAGAA